MVHVQKYIQSISQKSSGFRDRTKKELKSRLTKFMFDLEHDGGIYVMEEDWDNLILLDACRDDYFQESTSFDGEYTSKVSRAHESWGFMQENFVDEALHDTVYVTANPYSERLNQDTFYKVETVLDRWNSDTGTVLPEDVTEVALNAHDRYPNKRLIIHYTQPHTPHLGETAQKYDSYGWSGDCALPGNYKLGGVRRTIDARSL